MQYNFSRIPDFVLLFFVLVQNVKNNSTKFTEFSLLVQRFFGLVQNFVLIIIGTKIFELLRGGLRVEYTLIQWLTEGLFTSFCHIQVYFKK